MSSSIDVYGSYVGPEYVAAPSVSRFHNVPRFGRISDVTLFFSSYEGEQASYTTGLILLFLFTLLFFMFWIVAVITFKFMGKANAGFLSGNAFTCSPCEEHAKKQILNRPLKVRIVFLVSSAILLLFSVLLVTNGITNLEKTAETAESSLQIMHDKIEDAEEITISLEKVGEKSEKIRDSVVKTFDAIMCDDPGVEAHIGVSIVDLASKAKNDLTMLANFINEYIIALKSGLSTAKELTNDAESVLSHLKFSGWPLVLLAGSLFILPAAFVVGVGFAMMEIRIWPFELFLSYTLMPMFALVTVLCIILCCILLPVSVANADICTGGSSSGGPDDTIITIYRNLIGEDLSVKFLLVAYYTQRCVTDYYPFNFLSNYLDQLQQAQVSVQRLIVNLDDNLDFLQQECKSDGFQSFLMLAKSLKKNLDLLQSSVDRALVLVNCEDINEMYVSAVHDATCTQAPNALAWIYGSLLVISVCGMIMITLRASYLSTQYVGATDGYLEKKNPISTNDSKSFASQNINDNTEDEQNNIAFVNEDVAGLPEIETKGNLHKEPLFEELKNEPNQSTLEASDVTSDLTDEEFPTVLIDSH